jgi:hypothetical protein
MWIFRTEIVLSESNNARDEGSRFCGEPHDPTADKAVPVSGGQTLLSYLDELLAIL